VKPRPNKTAVAARLADTFVVTANPRQFTALGCLAWDYRNEPEPPAAL